MTLPSRPRVRADVFPAVLTVSPPSAPTPATSLSPLPGAPSRTLEKVRVIVTLDAVYVFQDASPGPALIFSERLADYTPPQKPPPRSSPAQLRALRREATLTTDSGKTLAFHRSDNCGCGSRLRGFDPFDSITTYASTGDSVL